MPVVELGIVGGLVLLNGFFAMSEIALVSSRPGRLRMLAEKGHRGAAAALKLRRDPTGFLSTVQVGITLVGIFAGAYGATTFAAPAARALETIPGLAGAADRLALGIVIVVITYLSLIAGELVPKRIALSNAETIASWVARPMTLLAMFGAPVVWFLRISTEAALRLLGISPTQGSTVTEEEVKSLISEGTRAGVFKPAEREIIEGVIRIADRSVRSIMVPRSQIAWLDIEAQPAKIIETVHTHGHSRYPVCRGEVDAIAGIVHTRDILQQVLRLGKIDLAAIVCQPLYLSGSVSVLETLDRFRTAPIHMAAIIDDRGTFEGIATPMDILTGMAGDLPEHQRPEGPDAVQRGDGSWLLDAGMRLHAVERVLGTPNMTLDDFETLAGFVLYNLSHLPEIGESFVWSEWRFEVVDMDGRRIDKVLASRIR